MMQRTAKQAMPQTVTASGLPVRSGLRVGAWDDIDDTVKGWWSNLTGAVTPATSTPLTTPAIAAK